MNWSTIESDPGVFTSLIQSFGTTGVEVSEIWGLDDACLPQQSYGLIFLFKWVGSKGDDNKQEEKGGNDSQDDNQEFPKMIPGPGEKKDELIGVGTAEREGYGAFC
jgi:hypothetical protein